MRRSALPRSWKRQPVDGGPRLSVRDGTRGQATLSRDRLPGAARLLHRPGRDPRPEGQCDHRAGVRGGPDPGGGGRPGAEPGRGGRPAARCPDDHQGVLQAEGDAHDPRLPGLRRQHRGRQRRGGGPAAGRRRGHLRQDQRAARPDGWPERQRHLWPDQQSLGPGAHAGRVLRRIGGGAGGRADRARARQRHRLLDPQSGALLRRLRA